MARAIYFHSFGRKDMDMPLEVFEEIVGALIKKGYSLTSVSDADWGNKNIIITFDDGYKNNLEAIKILANNGCSSTIFVCSHFIGEKGVDPSSNLYPGRDFLTLKDLQLIQNMGSEIGCHGAQHINYGTASDFEIREDLVTCANFLRRELTGEVTSFAFPCGQRGAFDHRSIRYLEDQGFSNVFTTVWGRARKNSFFKNRCEVKASDTKVEVLRKVKGFYLHRTLFDRVTNRGSDWKY